MVLERFPTIRMNPTPSQGTNSSADIDLGFNVVFKGEYLNILVASLSTTCVELDQSIVDWIRAALETTS